ncbi:MAG TPA: DUF3040 domain-containing protein [Actinophytocola sp.]|jgi:hypothetical protein|uniref:DUF3040 domain-containing protein n=1 Tax=Actinophytocola sp. TaxID=1872138 RepID=UPI002E04F4EC|nr:DUF3040 domain-containing protein [Actinophytocola sp.]
MLSQDDRRQLELIATHLRIEDPAFAQALSSGRPRRPLSDKRWPLVVAAVLAGLAEVAGVLAQSLSTVLLGALALIAALVLLRWQKRRSQGPKVRPSKRSPRPPFPDLPAV